MKYIFLLFMAMVPYVVSTSAKQKDQVFSVARPFLIVPGYSIGKVALGMVRATVHHKMGLPNAGRAEDQKFQNEKGEWKKHPVGTGSDTWERKGFDRKNNRKFSAGTLTVGFINNRVSSISLYYLSGYATSEGLSIFDSTFDQFEKRFGHAVKNEYNLDPESPTGISTAMQSVWDFPKRGLR